MNLDVLKHIVEGQADKHPLALATNLNTNEQQLIDPREPDAPEWLFDATHDALRSDKSRIITAPDEVEWFLNIFNTPLRLVIVGAVHIAQPLALMARETGYDVTVVDPREAFASPARFPNVTLKVAWPDDAVKALGLDARTALVALTHDPKLDDPALMLALTSPCFYVGALGSKKTQGARRERLSSAGLNNEALARINGPVGLNIGAKSPAEIAVSILAEMTQTLRQVSLRQVSP